MKLILFFILAGITKVNILPLQSLQYIIYIIKGDMSVCLSVADGRPNGWAYQDQTWHRDSC